MTKKNDFSLFTMGIVCSSCLLIGLAGASFAGPGPGGGGGEKPSDLPAHLDPGIILRDSTGAPIPWGSKTAFSMEETCGACHNGSDEWDNGVSYAAIEKHGYHSQMGANQLYGWNSWNPDSSNKYLTGPGAKGKNWVQSPGHVGKW